MDSIELIILKFKLEILKKQFLIKKENIYYKDKPWFRLTKEGKLIDDKNNIIDIHSGIAKTKGAKCSRLNGWDYWMVKRNDKMIPINNLRKKYLKEIKGYETKWY